MFPNLSVCGDMASKHNCYGEEKLWEEDEHLKIISSGQTYDER